MNWERMKTVNITTASGEPDTIHFETNNEGGFRLINDYGNECITFDMMTGLEMINRFSDSMMMYVNKEIQDDTNSMSSSRANLYPDADSSDDCQGEGV